MEVERGNLIGAGSSESGTGTNRKEQQINVYQPEREGQITNREDKRDKRRQIMKRLRDF